MPDEKPDRRSRGLTPVPYAPFEEHVPPRGDTEPCPPDPIDDDTESRAEHPSLDEITLAMARLESALQQQADIAQRTLERHATATREAVAAFLSTVLQRFDDGNRRFDRAEKAIRALNAEINAVRARAVPPLDPCGSLVDIPT